MTTEKPRLVLLGAGGHAQACIDVIEQEGRFAIAGIVGLPHELGQQQLSYRIFATDSELESLAKQHGHGLVAVGQITTSGPRERLVDRALRAGFELPEIISPRAWVSPHARVGAGTIVMHGAIVNAGAVVGAHCIVNSRALVEHGAMVEDHCHVATGAILNGAVRVGRGSFVGSGSVVKEGVTLGSRCIVGMGVSVRHHQPDDARVLA